MAESWPAVLGTGRASNVAPRRFDGRSGAEAIDPTLADWFPSSDIDAVVVGKAPTLRRVMMPELFMADAMGATGKPADPGTPPVRLADPPG